MKTRVFLGLGSNVGDREGHLRAAVARIGTLPHTQVVECSHVYETEPIGVKNQPEFLNLAVEIVTSLAPEDLHRRLKDLETSLGRELRERWGPREIDIDVLYFGSRIVDRNNLRIPHPERSTRRFVLLPVAELAPEFMDPESGMSVSDMLQQCPDRSSVRRSAINVLTPIKE